MGCCGDPEDKIEAEGESPRERGCTDVFWLCLYIVFWSLMVLIAAFAFVYGNPIRIINGYDSFGNTCGINNKKIGNLDMSGMDLTDKPYLLFFDVKELKRSMKVCIEQCPNETLRTADQIYGYYKKNGIGLCKYGFNYDDFTSRRIPDKNVLSSPFGPCPSLPIYASKPVLNRCVPSSLKEVSEAVMNNIYGFLNDWDTLEQIFRDVYAARKEILYLTLLAFILSLVMVGILHVIASFVAYLFMIGFSITSIAGTVYLWYTYFDIKNQLNNVDKNMVLLEEARNETAFLWYSVIATVITVIILIIVISLRKEVAFLAPLFRETSKCMFQVPGLMLQPLLTFVILIGFFLFWLFVMLCLATAYYPGINRVSSPILNDSALITTTTTTTPASNLNKLDDPSGKSGRITFVEYMDPTWVKYMWWVYFVGLIWTSEFIMACQQMVIAGAVAHWFYRHKYKDNGHVCYAVCKLIKYHLGSVALGSLLITVFKIPRLIMMYLHEKLRDKSDKGSRMASCCLKCCICCFYCVEKFIRYINHNAYTVIAIDGSNFCTAAGTAFQVLSANILQVATINSLGDFILFLAKCIVTALTGIVGLFLFRRRMELTFYAAPTLLCCVFAYLVAHCVLSLFEMILDTIYLCICQNGDGVQGMELESLGIKKRASSNTAAEQHQQSPELEPIK